MALTPAERKDLLGFGGLKAVADELGFKLGHVSQINSETRDDRSGVVRRAIATRIQGRHPEKALSFEDIWNVSIVSRSVAAAGTL